jgi:PPK2 family polyphosphate:nucleotide phosphotransferase
MIDVEDIDRFRVLPGVTLRLKKHDPGWENNEALKELGAHKVKKWAREVLDQHIRELAEQQELLWASGIYAVLVVLQGMDTSGKDGVIKHVMSGLNPQGCEVHSFKKPSEEELAHTFLWREMNALPRRGRVGIFNRSYYEEVLAVRVHPELLRAENLPPGRRGKAFWKKRFDDINRFERHLVRNGTLVLKFFLHISKEEQKRRLLDRLTRPEKRWKFSAADLAERAFWDRYTTAYEKAISATSTKWAPWYVIPSDHKWVARVVVAEILIRSIRCLHPSFPEMTDEQQRALTAAEEQLKRE